MNQDIKTIELAKLYENQGYFQEALDIYTFLDGQETSSLLQTAIKRMEKRIQEEGPVAKQSVPDQNSIPDQNSAPDQNRVPELIEQWLMLLVLRQRLAAFKKIRLRLQ